MANYSGVTPVFKLFSIHLHCIYCITILNLFHLALLITPINFTIEKLVAIEGKIMTLFTVYVQPKTDKTAE